MHRSNLNYSKSLLQKGTTELELKPKSDIFLLTDHKERMGQNLSVFDFSPLSKVRFLLCCAALSKVCMQTLLIALAAPVE
jgi:hypothetical protein